MIRIRFGFSPMDKRRRARATRVANQIEAGIVMVNCPFSAFPEHLSEGINSQDSAGNFALRPLDLYTETKSIISYHGSRPLNPFGIQ